MFNFSFKTCGKTSSPLANTGTCRVCPTFYNNNPIYRAPIRPWLQRRCRQVSRECYSNALWKKYVFSLDLKTDGESALIIVSGNEFQTVGAEQRKALVLPFNSQIQPNNIQSYTCTTSRDLGLVDRH